MKNNKTKRTKLCHMGVVMMSVCSIALLFPFVVSTAHAGFISCPTNVDLKTYPVCEFVDKWNESERFNELVTQIVTEKADEINRNAITQDNKQNTADLFKIFADARDQVKAENPGLFEKGKAIKAEIYAAIGQ